MTRLDKFIEKLDDITIKAQEDNQELIQELNEETEEIDEER